MRRAHIGFLATAVVAGALAFAACVPTSPPAGTALPDLAMLVPTSLTVTNPGDGTHLIRFGTTVVNIGAVDFRLHATRANGSTNSWTVKQVIPDGHGALVEYATPAGYVYGGDGHFHWHVKALATYRLYSLPNMTAVGQSTKSGFCFFDTNAYRLTLPGAPQRAVYNSVNCGSESATDSRMGMSVGWGDTYPKSLPGQQIDVASLPAGNYRLLVTADANRWFFEKTRANNDNYIDFRLSWGTGGRASLTVIGQGTNP